MAGSWSSESPQIRSYRELLQVDGSAGPEDLKKAYRKMALLYHPDRNPGDEARLTFERVKKAYEVLIDPIHVRVLNQSYLKERLFNSCVEGLNVSFGSFFGYRLFRFPTSRIPRHLRLGQEHAHERDDILSDWELSPVEENQSILDHPAYDSIEIIYAGRFTETDEKELLNSLKASQAVRLPWVVLNNQGIHHFLGGEYHKALRCYEELNQRVPNNIIFMYRLGLCHCLLGFQNPQRTFLGRTQPDRMQIDRGLRLFRHCLHVGESRSVGRQKCLVIRKVMAEVLEKSGRKWASRRLWRQIRELDPKSIEAVFKLSGAREAARLLAKRRRPVRGEAGSSQKLIKAAPR